MATYTVSPYAKKQFFDNSGNPLAAGRIYTYAAGTLNALTTYQTSSGTAWGAYVQLDSAGRPQTGDIYLQPGSGYKFIAQDSAGVVLWTQDNIAAVPASSVNVDIVGTAGAVTTAGDVCFVSAGDAGGTPGAWYPADADNPYSSTIPPLGFAVDAAQAGATDTYRTDGQIELAGPLTPGADYYVSTTAGQITTTAPPNARYVGRAQSATILAIALNPPQTGLDIFQVRALL